LPTEHNASGKHIIVPFGLLFYYEILSREYVELNPENWGLTRPLLGGMFAPLFECQQQAKYITYV
jgi:hypothetical protein